MVPGAVPSPVGMGMDEVESEPPAHMASPPATAFLASSGLHCFSRQGWLFSLMDAWFSGLQ